VLQQLHVLFLLMPETREEEWGEERSGEGRRGDRKDR
jgi:hypothetical protein